MNPQQPKVEPQGRYDTKRACAEIGISRSTLNRYRRAGLICPRYHKANMRPYYTGAEISKLWNLLM